nr:hypothetical protein Q903MT_gene6105 [Picea sitchensis]
MDLGWLGVRSTSFFFTLLSLVRKIDRRGIQDSISSHYIMLLGRKETILIPLTPSGIRRS